MHTLIIIIAGFVLLAVFCLIGWIRAGEPSLARAALVFIPVWAVVALTNATIGVLSAGYTVLQELPVFLVTFAVPAIAAVIIARRYQRS